MTGEDSFSFVRREEFGSWRVARVAQWFKCINTKEVDILKGLKLYILCDTHLSIIKMTTTKPATIVVFCLFLWVLSVLFMGLLLLWNRCLLFVYKPMLWRLTIYLFICLFIYFRNNHNNTGPAFKWWWQSSDGQGLECEVALPHCIFTGSLHRAWGHLCVRHTQMLGTKCFPVPDAFYFLMASTNQDSGKARLCCSQPVGWWGFTIVLTMPGSF